MMGGGKVGLEERKSSDDHVGSSRTSVVCHEPGKGRVRRLDADETDADCFQAMYPGVS